MFYSTGPMPEAPDNADSTAPVGALSLSLKHSPVADQQLQCGLSSDPGPSPDGRGKCVPYKCVPNVWEPQRGVRLQGPPLPTHLGAPNLRPQRMCVQWGTTVQPALGEHLCGCRATSESGHSLQSKNGEQLRGEWTRCWPWASATAAGDHSEWRAESTAMRPACHAHLCRSGQ